jgi:hypothetical protein
MHCWYLVPLEPISVEFRVDECSGKLGINRTEGKKYVYNLQINGEKAEENSKRVRNSPYRYISRSERSDDDVEEIYDVTIPNGRLKETENGERRVVYEIETVKSFKKRGVSARSATSYHSYHEFHDLHRNIVNQFQLLFPEMAVTLPKLPRYVYVYGQLPVD